MKKITGPKAFIVTAAITFSMFAVSGCDSPQTPAAPTVAITPPATATNTTRPANDTVAPVDQSTPTPTPTIRP